MLGAGWWSRAPWPLPSWLAAALVFRFCAGFRKKGRRPKNRSRCSFARAGLFQVFPGMLAVLERRYQGCILTLVQLRRFLAKRFRALSTHRRGPVEEPPRAERALRGGLRFLICLSRLCFLLPSCGCSNLRPLLWAQGRFPNTLSIVRPFLSCVHVSKYSCSTSTTKLFPHSFTENAF